MAVTGTFIKEMLISGNTRLKLYSIAHDGSTTGVSISPGTGFRTPMGSYVAYVTTTTAGEYDFSIVAGTSTYVSRIMFLA
jgi:hypothetical protein